MRDIQLAAFIFGFMDISVLLIALIVFLGAKISLYLEQRALITVQARCLGLSYRWKTNFRIKKSVDKEMDRLRDLAENNTIIFSDKEFNRIINIMEGK